MKILVIGSGGREHALVWKLRQSPRVTKIYCAPGNGGIADEAECVAVDVKSLDSMIAARKPDSARPHHRGAGAAAHARRGGRIHAARLAHVRPTQAAAQLESSKSFAKEFLQRHRIPTAHYAICDSPEQVPDALAHFHTPIVVKADGLAAGKGVVIAKTKDEAATSRNRNAQRPDAGRGRIARGAGRISEGDELSFLVVSDGERVAPLVAAQDHKRVGDGDTGPNTGGMGAYTTRPIIDDRCATGWSPTSRGPSSRA
jgi:phosphoribosylamine---glycine ligase